MLNGKMLPFESGSAESLQIRLQNVTREKPATYALPGDERNADLDSKSLPAFCRNDYCMYTLVAAEAASLRSVGDDGERLLLAPRGPARLPGRGGLVLECNEGSFPPTAQTHVSTGRVN